MCYNERLRIPNPRSAASVAELNVSINGFNDDVQKWETRFIEIKEYEDSLATHNGYLVDNLLSFEYQCDS